MPNRDGGTVVGNARKISIYQQYNLHSQTARLDGGLAYLAQVRRIAPPDPPGLIGRETELAELSAFCLEPDRGPYAWWQAGPWAGKSALLSTFVLRPPPDLNGRVRLVSFFITARLAARTLARHSPR